MLVHEDTCTCARQARFRFVALCCAHTYRRLAYPALAHTIQIFGHDQIFLDYRQKKMRTRVVHRRLAYPALVHTAKYFWS